MFQSTHPRGVRLTKRLRPKSKATSFNPRTLVGCDSRMLRNCHALVPVSIHAPSWGATQEKLAAAAKDVVSIHAPSWGATLNEQQNNFNREVSIHAPSWGATLAKQHKELQAIVSIHAPSWGATWNPQRYSKEIQFQSTHPRGVRQDVLQQCGMIYHVSIHAPSWGATHTTWTTRQRARCFNPRTLVGCDSTARMFHHQQDGFNPRTLVGCDE